MPVLILFCFRVTTFTSPYGTDGQTEGRARRVMWPIGQPHNYVLTIFVYFVHIRAVERLFFLIALIARLIILIAH